MKRQGFAADSHSVTSAVVFALVSLFALLALLVVLTGIRAYSGVNAAAEQNARERAAISYVVNRVRAADARGRVEVSQDGKSVCLTDSIDGEEFATRIYCSDGRLMEYFGYYDGGWDEEDGETIIEASDIKFSTDGALVSVEVFFADGGGAEMRVALRSAE